MEFKIEEFPEFHPGRSLIKLSIIRLLLIILIILIIIIIIIIILIIISATI